MASLDFKFHGVSVRVSSEVPSVLEHLNHDFHYFKEDPLRPPPLFHLRHLPCLERAHWREICQIKGRTFYGGPAGSRRVQLFPKAWVDYRPHQGATLYCDDEDLSYESCYQVILSFVGEKLDTKGLHRVHGAGVELQGEGTLLMAPSGTGKSTLLLEALRVGQGRLLSDDTPLVDASGRMWEFPQRIASSERPVFPADVRIFRRYRFGEKYVISAKDFSQRIGSAVQIKRLVLLRRGRETGLHPIGQWRMIIPLLRWLVVGHETPQFWELFLRLDRKDVLRKICIAFSRLRTAIGLVYRCEAFELRVSTDVSASWQFFHQKFSGMPC